jgi:hypothetical protein
MNTYVIYITATGEIVSCHSCDNIDSVVPLVKPNESYLDITSTGISNDQDIFKYFVDASLQLELKPPSINDQWNVIRQLRNGFLQASDWTDTYSAPSRLGQNLYNQWQTYRQALRDVTNQEDPFNIQWPTKPE